MGAYEIAESFESLSVKHRIVAILVIFSLIIGVVTGFYFLGKYHQREESATYYNEKTQELEKKVTEFETLSKVHDENQMQLMGENALLKKAIEAQAEILRKEDAKIALDAKKSQALVEERIKKVEEINIDNDFKSQVQGLCEDYKKSGVIISFCK